VGMRSTIVSSIGVGVVLECSLMTKMPYNKNQSLTHTADNAMEREREAEDRLDEALSLHARQMSQR
jgi:hypothetical protein